MASLKCKWCGHVGYVLFNTNWLTACTECGQMPKLTSYNNCLNCTHTKWQRFLHRKDHAFQVVSIDDYFGRGGSVAE